MQKVAIFDVDGTLANCDHRRHFVTGEARNWDAFYEASVDDPPNKAIVFLANACIAQGIPVILCTGRPAKYRGITDKSMRDFGVDYHELYMRHDGDHRDDATVKREMLSLIRIVFDPILAVDDRDRVVKMWREEGLTCLQCAEGNF